MLFMCEKRFVITLTPIYRTWVLLDHKTFCQLRLHTAIDLSSEYFKLSHKGPGTSHLHEEMDRFPFLSR